MVIPDAPRRVKRNRPQLDLLPAPVVGFYDDNYAGDDDMVGVGENDALLVLARLVVSAPGCWFLPSK